MDAYYFIKNVGDSLVKELGHRYGGHLRFFQLSSDLHVDLFAKHINAKRIEFPDAFQDSFTPTRCIRNEIIGTSLVIDDYYSDKLYKLKKDLFIGSITVTSIEYGDLMRSKITFVVAKDADVANGLIRSYYDLRRGMFIRCDAILDYYGEMIRDFRRMNWEDIFLPDDMAGRVRDEITAFFASKDIYDKRKIEWRRGILLAGEPGNGKTSICRAIATHSDVPTIYCVIEDEDSCVEIIRNLKTTIGKNAPCVAIIEDADFFGGNDRARAAFLNMMDGIVSCNGVMFIASTNNPDKLDFALTDRPSRFDSYYVIGKPQVAQREQILRAKLVADYKKMPKDKMTELISQMNGMTACAVQEVAVGAIIDCVKKNKQLDMQALFDNLARMKAHSKTAKGGSSKWAGNIGFER